MLSDTMTPTSAELDRRYGIDGRARIADGRGGLPRVRVETDAAAGEIYLHGAQVTSWQPANQAEVLFVSAASRWEAGKAIRGGIPICFPWFGGKADDPRAPAHGFVRTIGWSLDAIEDRDSGIVVSLSTASDERTRASWPYDFQAVLRATFGPTLLVELEVTNVGANSFTFEEALHTYFGVGDARAIRIAGLDGVSYLDKVDAFRERSQQGDIVIGAETDRVYLDAAGAVTIDDPRLGRRARISKTASHSTVVWNPWIDKARAMNDLEDDDWTRMVCVETCNVGSAAVTVEPGQRHAMALTVAVEPF